MNKKTWRESFNSSMSMTLLNGTVYSFCEYLNMFSKFCSQVFLSMLDSLSTSTTLSGGTAFISWLGKIGWKGWVKHGQMQIEGFSADYPSQHWIALWYWGLHLAWCLGIKECLLLIENCGLIISCMNKQNLECKLRKS